MEINSLKNSIDVVLDRVYPVGSIYLSTNNVNPSDLFGGIWESWGSGRVPVGINSNDTNFNIIEKTGGEKTHQLTINEMPSHQHKGYYTANFLNAGSQFGWIRDGGENETGDYLTTPTGGGNAHNNLQPYIVCSMWKRIA